MVNTSNLKTFGLWSTTKAAIFEVVTNALAATVDAPIRKIEVNTVQGKSWKATKNGLIKSIFPQITTGKYFYVLNSGAPFPAPLEKALNNGDSEKDGHNHQHGVGLKTALGMFTPEKHDYLIMTRYEDHCSWVSGPYEQNPPQGDFTLEEWPFDEWVTSAVIIRLENPNVCDAIKCEDFSDKYAAALIDDESLGIYLKNNKRVHADVPAKRVNVIPNIYVESIDSYIDIYEYTWKENNKRTSDVTKSGITIFNNGVKIVNAGVDIVTKISQMKKAVSADSWSLSMGYTGPMHHDFNGYATYVNVKPCSNKFFIEANADKSAIEWDYEKSPNAMKLRHFLDTVPLAEKEDRSVFDRFREAKEAHKEVTTRKYGDSMLLSAAEGNPDCEYIMEAGLLSCEGDTDITKMKKTDGMLIQVTDANREALRRYIESGRKGTYILGKKDFKDYVKIYEFKKTHKAYTDADLSQLVDYAEIIEQAFGLDPKEIKFTLYLTGGSITNHIVERAKFKAAKSGYEIEVIDSPVNDD